MNRRSFLGRAAAGFGLGAAALLTATASGCGGSGSAADAEIARAPQDLLKDSLKYSQDRHQQQKKKSRKSGAQR